MRRFSFVFSVLALGLAGCGGSGGQGDVVTDVPSSQTPTPTAPVQDQPDAPPPVVPTTRITLGQINTNAAEFAELLSDLDARGDLTELAPLDTVADLQARGNASYAGAFYVYTNAARVDGFVGNGVVNVGFADSNAPTVTGGAGGFVYVDGPELASVIESDTFEVLSGDTPVYDADGTINFANGQLANTSGVATAGFEIAGRLTADVGGTDQSLDVTGAMAVLFDGRQAFGVGGDTDDPNFDLSMPEAFFYGIAD